MSRHAANIAALRPLRAAQYDWEDDDLRCALDTVVADDAVFRLGHPFGDMTGPQAFHDQALARLQAEGAPAAKFQNPVFAAKPPLQSFCIDLFFTEHFSFPIGKLQLSIELLVFI